MVWGTINEQIWAFTVRRAYLQQTTFLHKSYQYSPAQIILWICKQSKLLTSDPRTEEDLKSCPVLTVTKKTGEGIGGAGIALRLVVRKQWTMLCIITQGCPQPNCLKNKVCDQTQFSQQSVIKMKWGKMSQIVGYIFPSWCRHQMWRQSNIFLVLMWRSCLLSTKKFKFAL